MNEKIYGVDQFYTGGYKLHTVQGTYISLIREFVIAKASRNVFPEGGSYSVMKRFMNGDNTFVTMVRKYGVKAIFLCPIYNILTLLTLKKSRTGRRKLWEEQREICKK